MEVAVLVEDNLMFAAAVEPVLRRLGYTTKTVSGGPEAIAALSPALVLVNLASNRFDGAALIRSLRLELAETPIVGYAGHVERDLLHAGKEAGATLVAPNSAIRGALPEVLAKLG